ncbi:MAG: hypothetical protein EPO21_07320 [Chloroflexota bacterium]|nr:MAG: hypothetical protein EPO21_07320 [Chloroflexota bacterium]
MRQLQSLQRARQALESHSELMGSCRQLRNILLSSSAANYFGAILVTGLRGSSEELATTCGLAKAMAEVSTAGVLLVDADCQHPVLHDLFDVPLSPGLSDLADDQRELAGVVRPISDRLALLTNGSDGDRASRLLSVDPRVRWFGEARDRYDFIVLNAPALLSSLTATAAAALAGNVVLMVEAERDDELSARKARGLLNQVGARILGLALVDSRKF